MPHWRSPSKVAEGRSVLAEGLVCRESNVAERLVNRRWMVLYGPAPGGAMGNVEPPVLASFRHEGDAEPSKLWTVRAQAAKLRAGPSLHLCPHSLAPQSSGKQMRSGHAQCTTPAAAAAVPLTVPLPPARPPAPRRRSPRAAA